MKAYGRNLRWIEDHQYGDGMHRNRHARVREKARAEAEALQAAVQEVGAAALKTYDPEGAWRGSAAINYTIPGADICTVYARN